MKIINFPGKNHLGIIIRPLIVLRVIFKCFLKLLCLEITRTQLHNIEIIGIIISGVKMFE